MAQTATFYILQLKEIETLKNVSNSNVGKKKGWLNITKKASDKLLEKLEEVALEKIFYRWSGQAFPVLAVFSKEKLGVDWGDLQYSKIALELLEKRDAGLYIFSVFDDGLLKLKLNGMFYTLPELNEFAIEFVGNKPGNPDIMKNAVEVFNQALSKLTKEHVVVLSIV
jgi:hypothetical protein